MFLLEREDKPEKGRGGGGRGGGVNVEIGVATFLLHCSSITFTLCVGKVKFPILLFGSSVF